MIKIDVVGGWTSFIWGDNNETNEEDYFFDEELDVKFEELFGQSEDISLEDRDSLLIKKLRAINEKKFSEDMLFQVDSFYESMQENIDDSSIHKNAPLSEIDRDGKYFTFPNRFGVKTLVFLVKEQADVMKNIGYYGAELLDCIEEKQEDGRIVQTFYIKRELFNECQVLLFHIDYTEQCIYLNNGIIARDSIRISEKPQLFVNDSIVSEEHNSSWIYSQETVSDEVKEITVPTKVSGSLATIIDLEKWRPVLRENYFDEKDKTWKAYIRLQKKQYFVFKLRRDGCFYWKLSNLEIGHNYRCGSGGYPKNCIEAAVYLEKDGGAEALYEIAQIFLNDKNYGDEAEGKYYLKQAADKGNRLAWIEYVLRCNCTVKSEEFSIEYDSSTNEKFIKAMLFEKEGKWKNAFELYYSLANEKYKVANWRLGCDLICETEEQVLYENYILSVKSDDGKAEYCIYLLCNDLFFENREIGFSYLKLAADKGCKSAIYNLAQAYDEGIDVTIDKAKALNYYLLLTEDDEKILLEVSNRMIDGIGCEKSKENNKKAFDLLYHANKSSNNSTIVNNLGWMYEKGCGCDVDYCKAKKAYERSYNLENKRAAVHLGDMYFKGLGVGKSINMAKKYYTYAAEKGDSKGMERLNMIENSGNESMNNESHLERPYVFISYAHKDCEHVIPLIEKLKNYNVNLWYDKKIVPGSEWDESIASKIKLSSVVIAFVSKSYLDSANCRDELKFARNQGVKRLLVYLENVSLTNGMELRMGMQQAILYYKFDEKQELYDKLLSIYEVTKCIDDI